VALRKTPGRFLRLIFPAATERRQIRHLLTLAISVARVLLVSILLITIPWVVDSAIRGGPLVEDPDRINTTVALLTTVIGFLGVATLAISISLTLVDAAMNRYLAHIAEPLVEDEDRDNLLKLLFLGFVVTISNISLLGLAFISTTAALLVPMLLAILAFALLIGYTMSRIRFFDPRHLARHFVSDLRHKRQAAMAKVPHDKAASEMNDTILAQMETAQTYSRLLALCRANIEDHRGGDAMHILEQLIECLIEHARARLSSRELINGLSGKITFIDFATVAKRPSTDVRRWILRERTTGPGLVRNLDQTHAALWLEPMALQLLPSLLVVAQANDEEEFAEAWFSYTFGSPGILDTIEEGDLVFGELILTMIEHISSLELTEFGRNSLLRAVSNAAVGANYIDQGLGIQAEYHAAFMERAAALASKLIKKGTSASLLHDELRNQSQFLTLFSPIEETSLAHG